MIKYFLFLTIFISTSIFANNNIAPVTPVGCFNVLNCNGILVIQPSLDYTAVSDIIKPGAGWLSVNSSDIIGNEGVLFYINNSDIIKPGFGWLKYSADPLNRNLLPEDILIILANTIIQKKGDIKIVFNKSVFTPIMSGIPLNQSLNVTNFNPTFADSFNLFNITQTIVSNQRTLNSSNNSIFLNMEFVIKAGGRILGIK